MRKPKPVRTVRTIVKRAAAPYDLTPALRNAGYDVPPHVLLREGYAKPRGNAP